MFWVYCIVSLGLVGIMVETWLSFRKEREELDEDLARVRHGIQQHDAATTQLEEKRQQLDSHINQLRGESEQYNAEVELKRQTFDELLQRWRLHNPGDPFDTDSGRPR